MKALSYLNKYIAQHRYRVTLGVVFTIAANILSIVPGRLIKHTFALVQEFIATHQHTSGGLLSITGYHRFSNVLLMQSGLIVIVAALRGLFLFLSRQTIMIVGKRIEYALKNEIYAHYQALPMKYYRKYSTGDLMTRIMEDVNHVGMYLGPAIMYGIHTIMTFLIIIPYMLIVNTRLALYAILPIVVIAAGNYYISGLIKERSEAIQHKFSRLTTFVQESFLGINVLQAFTRNSIFTQKFAEECDAYKDRFLQLTAVNAIFFPVAKGIVGMGIAFIVLIGGQEIMQGQNTLGNITEFIMCLNLLGWPTVAVSWINSIVQRAEASQQRIHTLLKENTVTSRQSSESPIKGHIAFSNVSFTYPDTNTKAVNALEFEIGANKTLAIVGATGTGKSTIAHLMTRIYNADSGSVIIDGKPIQDYSISFLRRQIGYVPQDVFLFSGTIKDNILWGAPNATMEQVTQAARQASIYTYIKQLPQQFETKLGERGVTLSGGQKQRIAMARAFIRAPKILLLDDCLSALDAQTTGNILAQIAHTMQNSTVLLISHNVSSTKFADHIIVLESGSIVEQGSPAHLLAHQGVYYTLYKQQQHTP